MPTESWQETKGMTQRKHAFWVVLVTPSMHVAPTIERYLGNMPHALAVSKLMGIPDHWDRHQMDEGLPRLLFEQHPRLPVQQIVKTVTLHQGRILARMAAVL